MTVLDLSGMRAYLDGDKEEEREIVAVFVSKSQKDIVAIEQSINASSLEDWSEACHSLKGSAALLGAEELRDLCQHCETLGSFDNSLMNKKLVEIKTSYDRVIEALKEECLI